MKKQSARKSDKKTNTVQGGNSVKKRWLVFIVGASTVFLLAVAFLIAQKPVTITRPLVSTDATTRGNVNRDLQASSPTDVKELNRAKAHVRLPKVPAEFSSEVEQKRLLEDVNNAVKQFPSDATVLHIAALTYSELLQTERAVELFQRSLAANPRDAEVLVAYAKMSLSLDREQEIIALLQASGNADLVLSQLLLGIGNIDEGVKHAQIAADRLSSVDAYLVLIAAHKARGDSALAFNTFCRAKKMAPNDARLAEFKP